MNEYEKKLITLVFWWCSFVKWRQFTSSSLSDGSSDCSIGGKNVPSRFLDQIHISTVNLVLNFPLPLRFLFLLRRAAFLSALSSFGGFQRHVLIDAITSGLERLLRRQRRHRRRRQRRWRRWRRRGWRWRPSLPSHPKRFEKHEEICGQIHGRADGKSLLDELQTEASLWRPPLHARPIVHWGEQSEGVFN